MHLKICTFGATEEAFILDRSVIYCVLLLQEAKANLETAVPGLLQKEPRARLSYMFGFVLLN